MSEKVVFLSTNLKSATHRLLKMRSSLTFQITESAEKLFETKFGTIVGALFTLGLDWSRLYKLLNPIVKHIDRPGNLVRGAVNVI